MCCDYKRKFELVKEWLINKEDLYDGMISRKDISRQIDKALEINIDLEKRVKIKNACRQRLINEGRYL